MLSAIFSALGGTIVDKIFSSTEEIFKAYFNKQISAEQARAEILKAMLAAISQVEVAHADALAKMYASFTQLASQSLLIRVLIASVGFSQLAVLLWHQMGIPAMVYFFHVSYPSSGTTVDWAYALLGLCIGGGAIALRTGPAALNTASWKTLVGR